uniref:Uncharacterized protein n=1 Tax=Fagus sylvatica TaxID=28930 RepID=A0A2N9FFB8_FAGSY
MVFPNFSVRISVSLEMLSVNRENLVVEKVALFEKVLAFRKLMVRIGKILQAKVGCQSDFLVGSPFSGVDSEQLENALEEPTQPDFRFPCAPPNDGKTIDQFPIELSHGSGQISVKLGQTFQNPPIFDMRSQIDRF